MLGDPFRLPPAGPASAYKTYAVTTPPGEKYWVPATCEDVDCDAFLNGWVTRVPFGAEMYAAVLGSGRKWITVETDAAGVTSFTFAPGTECFRSSTHRVKVGRPDLFVVRDGDWRGNPLGTRPRLHARPEDWVEDFSAHVQAINERIEKG